MENLIKDLLVKLGEDPEREGLKRTPQRVKRSFEFLTDGYKQDPEVLIKNALFTDKYDEMVIVKDISLFSLCEHHLLPFHGKAHVAYLPKGKLVGISKIARMVDLFAKRLQLQERLTQQIAETLNNVLKPRGVAVVLEAEHLCMQMRGVEKQGASVVTSAMLGAFRNSLSTREEFINLIRVNRR